MLMMIRVWGKTQNKLYGPEKNSTKSAGKYPAVVFLPLLLFLLFSWPCWGGNGSPAKKLTPHEDAVSLARQGQFSESLAILKNLYHKDPHNKQVFYDYLTVLNWAEKDAEAVSLIQHLDPSQVPSYVLQAAAKSARREGLFELAETLYRWGIKRFPEQLDFNLGLVLTLTDMGHYAEALGLLKSYQQRWPENRFYRLAQAYIAEKQGDYYQALKIVQEELARAPEFKGARNYQEDLLNTFAALDQLRSQPKGEMKQKEDALFASLKNYQDQMKQAGNTSALRGETLVMEKLGAADLAREKSEKFSGNFNTSEMTRIRVEDGGLRVRWGELPPKSEKEEFKETHLAIKQLEEILSSFNSTGASDRLLQLQTRFDLMVAWRDALQMEKVIHEYHLLQEEGWTVFPHYVLEALADAWLYFKKPEIARSIYQQILRNRPNDFNAKLGLFYASIECEDFKNANQMVEELRESQEPWDYSDGYTRGTPNNKKFDADMLGGLNHYYRDELPEAEDFFTSFHELAPSNTDIIKELGVVYQSRGWPRLSNETFQLGLGLEPEHKGIQIALAQTYLDLREYQKAEELIKKLYLRYPNDVHVLKLWRLWEIHNMRELRLEAGYGQSDGSSEGDQDLFLEGVLFSRPMHENYRAFAGYRFGFGSFPEGDENFHRLGAGFEYRGPDLTGLAEATWNFADGGDPGLRLAAEWELNDYWSFPIELELFSRETPLRALKNGVNADAASLAFNYRASESREFSLLARFMNFSDGNFRSGVFTRFSQRLLTYPKYKLTAHLEVDGTSNTKDNTPYYNPEQDLTTTLTLDNLHRIWRRYDRSFSHRLMLSAGNYWQKDFGSNPIANACYEQIHEAAYRLEWVYGVCYGQSFFDGDAENRAYVYSRLGWKF